MPALITHDFFGRDVYDQLYREIGGTRDEAEAFLLGNQGPDPLFYLVANPTLHAHNHLANTMHTAKPSELIAAFKQSLSILDEREFAVGRAYALGFLCHYTLDSTAHPFIFFHQYRLCDVGEPGLSRADGREVHATIESELDELVLFEKQEQTVATFNPALEILKADDHVLDTLSKMYAYVVLTVYGTFVPADLFKRAVKSFRRVQRLFYSPTGQKRALISGIEERVRPYSFYGSMSHRPVALKESAFDNHAHETWNNPFTGDASTEGFWDLYERALDRAHAAIAAFDAEDFDLAAARELTGELDFSGAPTVAVLVSVSDGDGAQTCGATNVRAADEPASTAKPTASRATDETRPVSAQASHA